MRGFVNTAPDMYTNRRHAHRILKLALGYGLCCSLETLIQITLPLNASTSNLRNWNMALHYKCDVSGAAR
eukprot:3668939-Lingulodinium_polyedra.AAC.1